MEVIGFYVVKVANNDRNELEAVGVSRTVTSGQTISDTYVGAHWWTSCKSQPLLPMPNISLGRDVHVGQASEALGHIQHDIEGGFQRRFVKAWKRLTGV